MKMVYRGSLPHATQLLAGLEEGHRPTGGFKKFLTTIQVRLPDKVHFAEFDGEFELPKEFICRLEEQGLKGELQACSHSLLHVRTPWKNDRKKEMVMWFLGSSRHNDGSSFRKVSRSLADLIIGTSADVEVRTPTPEEQREYEIHMPWIVKASHPKLHFRPLPNLFPSSFRASKDYALIDIDRQLDVIFRLNTPERIERGECESIIQVAEMAKRGHGYDFARDLVKGCPNADVFYLSYKRSALLEKLSEAV